ncbi:hypothetical protein T01_1798 [Trichinella spiralis]|uniref:Uncharacterized protein n=1 Tax=Trichinella spiralis TaxID=6334 RepID=A0A0V1BJT7_TRISP|nr:hypothetical protein T01_1798 [Trichinella spiralis]
MPEKYVLFPLCFQLQVHEEDLCKSPVWLTFPKTHVWRDKTHAKLVVSIVCCPCLPLLRGNSGGVG